MLNCYTKSTNIAQAHIYGPQTIINPAFANVPPFTTVTSVTTITTTITVTNITTVTTYGNDCNNILRLSTHKNGRKTQMSYYCLIFSI